MPVILVAMKHLPFRNKLLVASFALMSVVLVLPSIAADNEKLANIPKSEYHARRQKLLSQIKDGIIVMVGAREEDLGEVGRFRQHNDFMYLTGVQTPAAYLIFVPSNIAPNKAQRETVFIPPRDIKHEQWTGVQIGPGSEGQSFFGLEEVAPSTTFKERLTKALAPSTADAKPLKI